MFPAQYFRHVYVSVAPPLAQEKRGPSLAQHTARHGGPFSGMALDLDLIRSQVNLVEYAQTLTRVRRLGSVWRGECPCCASSANDPFLVDPGGSGSAGGPPHFKCFACGERGDVFNLVQVERTGSPSISKGEFAALARATAERFGIVLPEESGPRVRSAEEILRARVAEAWGIVHEDARTALSTGAVPAAVARCGALGISAERTAALGFGAIDPAAMQQRLARLGLDVESCRAAGLSPKALSMLQSGLVLLRGAPGALGLTQEQLAAKDTPARMLHLTAAAGTGFGPHLTTDVPRGLPDDRQLVVALEWRTLIDATTKHATLVADAPTESARRVVRSIAIGFHDPQEPCNPELTTRLTARALILVPAPDTSLRQLSLTGAQWVSHGVGVRVAAPWERASPRLQDLLEAREFVDWQFSALRADEGIAPGSDDAEMWFTQRIAPLATTMHEPGAQAVVTYRGMIAAGLIVP
jgi:hypothetical protein